MLLPYQVSILHFSTLAVSATNLLYNVVAIPGGIWRFFGDRRLAWPLTVVTVLGTLPGIAVGFFVRVSFINDVRPFKLFVGLVLLLVGARLAWDVARERRGSKDSATAELKAQPGDRLFSWPRVRFDFEGKRYDFHGPALVALSFAVGVIGGIYGSGGGAIIAPVLVSVLGLPVHAVAGAALLGTLITSVFGVLMYAVVGPLVVGAAAPVGPDWLLGLTMGAGGFCGIYLGARVQKHVPALPIKLLLLAILLLLAGRYILQYFA